MPGAGGFASAGGTASSGGVSAVGGVPGVAGASASGGVPGSGGVTASGASGSGGTTDVPPPDTQQYTFVMDSFHVDPGGEFYECQDQPNPFGVDVAIVRTESTVSLGAHHLYLFQIPSSQAAFNPPAFGQPALTPAFTPDGKKTPVFNCPDGGFEFHPYLHLTQRQYDVISYPDGIGRSLSSSEATRFMVHYLNTTSDPIDVGASVTVDYEKASGVSQLAAGIFVYAPALQVPPGMSTQTFSYPVARDMSLLQMTGHMHQRGVHYEAHVRTAAGDDRIVYTSDTWDEPPTQNFSPPLSLKAGDSVRYSCTYVNGTSTTLTYGESAATNEMCNLFGVYFPATSSDGISSPVLGAN
ncbi:MAG TPA: hypothetical protein VHC69_16805 [Polyangiaceae bacterium]|nr:hypothetical protein [Polyangiaceae bacterium]